MEWNKKDTLSLSLVRKKSDIKTKRRRKTRRRKKVAMEEEKVERKRKRSGPYQA